MQYHIHLCWSKTIDPSMFSGFVILLLQTCHTFVYHHLCLVRLPLLETHSSLSCYMPPLCLVTADKNSVFVYLSLTWLCTRKCLNILDVNCLPLSCIILLGLPLMIIQSSSTLRRSTDLFLSDHLLATFLEQSFKQLMIL